MVMKREDKRRKGLLSDPLDPLDGGGGGMPSRPRTNHGFCVIIVFSNGFAFS